MKKLDQYIIYDIGTNLQPLHSLNGDIRPADHFWTFFPARNSISSLIDEHIPLSTPRNLANQVLGNLNGIIKDFYTSRSDAGIESIFIPDEKADNIPFYRIHWLKQSLSEFEVVFREEMKDLASYLIPRTGIYSTSELLECADHTFPLNVRSKLPAKSVQDWNEAGKCLALQLYTACAFHVARAVEGVLEFYFAQCCGNTNAKPHSWGEYLKQLEQLKSRADQKGKLTPSSRVLGDLRRLKDEYRNPIIHPEVTVSENDARIIFSVGESFIGLMMQEIVKNFDDERQGELSFVEDTGSGGDMFATENG